MRVPRCVRRASLAAWTFPLALVGLGLGGPALADAVSFESEIQPILQIRCVECHKPGGEGYDKSGLDLTTYEGLVKGTRFGRIVVPGDTLTSNLVAVVDGRVSPKIQMPHNRKPLTHCEIDLLKRWVNQGAKNN